MEFKRSLILRLAIAGVLCTTVAAADDDAATIIAAETVATEVVATEAVAVSAEATSRSGAKAANEDAAKKAVEAVLADTRLDLDIRLIGPTSVKIASER